MSERPFQSPRRLDAVLFGLILVGALLRVNLATTKPYIPDESEGYLRLAASISFSPGQLSLPIRGKNHPALVGYVVKASRAIFGSSSLGTRALHILSGLLMVLLIASVAQRWYGLAAARWSAALLLFNEYDLAISSFATSHAPYLFFISAAVYFVSRFLDGERIVFLVAASVATAFAFYCKELAAFVVLVIGVAVLCARNRKLIRTPSTYLAVGIFLVVISPDLWWNWRGGNPGQATYGYQLARMVGVGFSAYPFAFYAQDLVKPLAGEAFVNRADEYQSMNSAIGLFLLFASVLGALRWRVAREIERFLILLFAVPFVFFVLIDAGHRTREVGWFWVDMTMLPAAIFAGAYLAGEGTTWKWACRALAAGAMAYAVVAVLWR